MLVSISISLVLMFGIFSQYAPYNYTQADRLYTLRDEATNRTHGAQDKSPSAQDKGSTSMQTQTRVPLKSDSGDDSEDIPDINDAGAPTPSRITAHMASLDPRFCVQYDKATRLITVACKSANLSHVNDVLKNPTVLKDEGAKIWLLNANLTIADGANFNIDSNDTKWLKINSTTSGNAYHIETEGNLIIDGVKITSWNTTSNNYTTTDGKIHRASIAVLPGAKGKMNITNSELGGLGYGTSLRQGIAYYGGDGSEVRNNTIHDLWYGFYSKGIGNLTLEDNHIFSNVKYGVDPHTGTHDMIIRNNHVHENEGLGIVCSFDCKNIVIEGNKVHDNKLAGIMLSRNVMNSEVRNNTLYNEVKAVVISESHGDRVYNNNISDSAIGIEAKFGSSKNKIYNNTILNSDKYGIQLVKGAIDNVVMQNSVLDPAKYGICVYNNGSQNIITENSILKSQKHGICVYDKSSSNVIYSNLIDGAAGYGIYVTDHDAKNNSFIGNQIRMAKVGVSVSNNSDSEFAKNNIGVVEDAEYYIAGNSSINLKNTTFSSDMIKSADGDKNTV
jgi:poly(beta-D-mannuronate) C5 epimerase